MRQFLLFIIAVFMMLYLAGCRSTRSVAPSPVVLHDTVYRSVVQRDSVFVDRWHTQWQNGDTIFLHDSIYCWRDRAVHDTVKVREEVPVEMPKEVVREVEKPLSWWQGLMIRIGYIVLIGFVGYIGYRVWQRRYK